MLRGNTTGSDRKRKSGDRKHRNIRHVDMSDKRQSIRKILPTTRNDNGDPPIQQRRRILRDRTDQPQHGISGTKRKIPTTSTIGKTGTKGISQIPGRLRRRRKNGITPSSTRSRDRKSTRLNSSH